MKFKQTLPLMAALIAVNTVSAQPTQNTIEETTVIADRLFSDTTVVSPASKITGSY